MTEKKRRVVVIYVEEKENTFCCVSLARDVIQNAYVSSEFRSVIRGILLFPFSSLATFTDLQAENERKTVPTIVFPEPKAFKVTASGSSTPLISTNPLFQKTQKLSYSAARKQLSIPH